ncbi:MAG: S8 family serine peptidase [Desulfuromonadales bacterium]|nr:S8 family serine peptidase [Desulfuromonadales bacterium]
MKTLLCKGLGLLALMLFSGPPCTVLAADVIIKFKEKPGPAEKALLQQVGGKEKRQFKLLPAISAQVPEQAISALKRDPRVEYVHEDFATYLAEPLETGIEQPWGVERVAATVLHAQGIVGAGVKIAVLDSGIDYTHPALAANYRGGATFISDSSDPMDDSAVSHGTHVAGILAATPAADGVPGVAPAAELYALKVIGVNGLGTTSALIAGLDWAVSNRIDIANISLATAPSQALEEACRAAYGAGMLLVAAAGNTLQQEVTYPARYDSVIAAAATAQDDQAALFSATGDQVELAAPGVGIYSTIRNGGYGVLSGTSQAAPHVAGVAALLLSAGLSDLNGDGSADHHDLRLQLQAGALDLGVIGWDRVFGHGLVQAAAAATTPVERFTLVKQSGAPEKSSQSVVLTDAIFEISILNDDLSRLGVSVTESGVIQRELSTIFNFNHKAPVRQPLVVDARGRLLDVSLRPDGRPGSSATVSIQAIHP